MGFGLKTIRRVFPTENLSPDIDWIKKMMGRMGKFYPRYDYFAILRPTSPFRRPETIRRAWKSLQESGFDSLKAYIEPPVTPYKMFEIKRYDETRQIMTPLMTDVEDAYLYPSNTFRARTFGAQVGFLDICRWENVEGGNHFGKTICPFQVDPLEAWDINTPLDWDIAEYLLESRRVEL
jgi:CMP-N-acetylneuraminic acid synthetase